MEKDKKKELVKQWDDLGFLKGLKGHVKDNIAELYCCKSPVILKEEKTEGLQH